jgi:3-oxoadipate enol-lactonase
MPTASIGNCVIYYGLIGQGKPLVMIRGVSSNADHWYANIPVLEKHYRLLVFDNRGIARSSDPQGPYTILDMARDTVGLMDAVGIEKAHVLGLSMGGMIAQEIAISFPDRVDKLILVVTHCGGSKHVKATPEVQRLFSDLIELGTNEARTAAGACLFTRESLEKRPEIVQRYAEVSAKFPVPPEILKKQWQAVGQFDAWSRLPRIAAQTLVMAGDQDALIPPENSRILAERISQSQLAIIKGGGHQVLIEQPEACHQAILKFLAG